MQADISGDLRSIHHELFYQFKCWQGEVEAGITPNFLGVMTRESYFSMLPQHSERRLVVTDYPAFDEEYFEWIDLLEAVMHAQGAFVMVELGAGWGRWLVNASAAVQGSSRMPTRLIGVEAEPTHFQWMKLHFRENGLDPNDHQLIQAAVADRDTEVSFTVGRPNEWYGQAIVSESAQGTRRSCRQLAYRCLQPLVSQSDWLRRLRRLSGGGRGEARQIERVKAVSLNTLLRPLERVDLIDLDVQGAELIVVEAAADQLDRKVRKIHIGTHGHEIESGLRSFFRGLGWQSVNDYACNTESHTPWGVIQFQDGVQTWINPGCQGEGR